MVAVVEFMVVVLIRFHFLVELAFLASETAADFFTDDHQRAEGFLDGGSYSF